jgi:hypothetical protein
MGGTAVTLPLVAKDGQSELSYDDALEVWDAMITFLRNSATHEGLTVISGYMSTTVDDLEVDANGIHFAIQFWEGCDVAARISEHWLKMLVTSGGPWNELIEEAGFEQPAPPRTLSERWLAGPQTPFISIRGSVLAVLRDGSGFLVDPDRSIASMEDLTDYERSRVQGMAQSGECACALCSYLLDVRDDERERYLEERARRQAKPS